MGARRLHSSPPSLAVTGLFFLPIPQRTPHIPTLPFTMRDPCHFPSYFQDRRLGVSPSLSLSLLPFFSLVFDPRGRPPHVWVDVGRMRGGSGRVFKATAHVFMFSCIIFPPHTHVLLDVLVECRTWRRVHQQRRSCRTPFCSRSRSTHVLPFPSAPLNTIHSTC
jgi:hypothetical protein